MGSLHKVKALEIALERWVNVLSHDSQNEQALYFSASNCIALKKLKSSEKYISQLSGLSNPGCHYRVYELKALQAAQAGNYPDAIKQWGMAVDTGYGASRGHRRIALEYLAIARDYYKHGDTARAQENVYSAVHGNSHKIDKKTLQRAKILEAQCLVKERKWLKAIEVLEDAEHYAQLREQALGLLQKCYIHTANPDKIESLLKTIDHRNPALEYFKVAREYFLIGDTATARKYINYVLVENRESICQQLAERATVLEARCLLREKKWTEAIQVLSDAETFAELRETALRILFKCYLYSSKLDNAEYICSLFDSEEFNDRHSLRGQLLFRQMNYQEAREAFQNANQNEDPMRSSIWLIKTLMALNEHDSAESHVKQVEQQFPEDYVLQGRCWESAGKIVLAEKRFRKGVEKSANTQSQQPLSRHPLSRQPLSRQPLSYQPLAYEQLVGFYHNHRYWGKAHHYIEIANNAGMGSDLMDTMKVQIEAAYNSIRSEKSGGESTTVPLEFLSTESMISAIVERILTHKKRRNMSTTSLKKVAIIISSLGPGGAERQAVNLANGLLRGSNKNEVVLLCTHLSRKVQDLFYAPLLSPEIEMIEYYNRDQVVTEELVPELSDYWDLITNIQPLTRQSTIVQMARAIIDTKPDVVHAWLDETFINASLVCGMLGIGNVVGRWGSMPAGVNRTVTERSLHNIDYLEHSYSEISRIPGLKYTSNSRLTGNAYAEMMSIEEEKVEIVYNGVNADSLVANPEEVDQLRQSLGIPDTALVVGTVIRLSEEKRPELWLQVASDISKLYPDLHFVIAGAGPLESRIAEVAATLDINIHLVGKQENVGAWYQMFDVLLLTSRVEGVSNVVIEAQWCGVPVVVPNVGGLSEAVLHRETGFLLENDSVGEFSSVVLSLIRDTTLREKMGSDAAAYARDKFSSDQMVQRYQSIYGV